MNILRLLAFIVLVMHIAMSLPSAGDQGATGVVEKLHTTLLAVRKDGDQTGCQGRYDQFAPVLEVTFDMSFS